MPRKSSKPVEMEPVVDIAADVEAIDAEPLAHVVVEVVPDAPEVEIPADEQVRRFTLDAPPARIADLPRHMQKSIILRANLWTAQGMTAHEALTQALDG